MVFKLAILFRDRGELRIIYAQCGKIIFLFTFWEIIVFFACCALCLAYYIILCAQVHIECKDQ